MQSRKCCTTTSPSSSPPGPSKSRPTEMTASISPPTLTMILSVYSPQTMCSMVLFPKEVEVDQDVKILDILKTNLIN